LSNGAETIHGSVMAAADAHPERAALMYRREGRYATVSYAALAGAVGVAAERLRAFGLRKGDTVGILSPNRPHWIIADLAVLSLGGIVVPVYPTLPADQLGYIVGDSQARMLLVGDAGLFPDVDLVRERSPNLEEVIFLDEWGVSSGDDGPAAVSDGVGFASARVAASDPATIVYTSGTTGEPKGVVLTHGNIVSNARALIKRYDITRDDSIVSYLPLAHAFERTCGHYVFLFAGGTVAYAESRATVAEDVRAIRPTVLIAVPRVLEKACEVARDAVESGPWVRRGVVHRAVGLLNERANLRFRGASVPLWLDARCRMYDALVARRFRAIAGGRLRLIVSGGASLDRQTGKILKIMGFGIVEGYGLTEASPVVTCGRVDDHRLGSVGPPLDGVEVRIAPSGEIQVRGPNVMPGYHNKPRETAAVLDREGWLSTGDLGSFDDRGNLIVTGRIKEIIVTAYGKNVSPAPVEERLVGSAYIDQAVVFGDDRKCIVALLVPARDEIERYAGEHGASSRSYESLLDHYAVRELIAREVERANAGAAPYERVAEFGLIADPFTQENGLLTPMLKARRREIERVYGDRIAALYEGMEERRAH
jgi:long-chain acyl-CoA synthetase